MYIVSISMLKSIHFLTSRYIPQHRQREPVNLVLKHSFPHSDISNTFRRIIEELRVRCVRALWSVARKNKILNISFARVEIEPATRAFAVARHSDCEYRNSISIYGLVFELNLNSAMIRMLLIYQLRYDSIVL